MDLKYLIWPIPYILFEIDVTESETGETGLVHKQTLLTYFHRTLIKNTVGPAE